MWTRGDDKLLELLLIRHFPRWDVIASCLLGNRTPEQVWQRYESMLDEVTRVLQDLEVGTPREWDAPPAPEREAVALLPAAAAPADVVTVASLSAGEEAVAAAAPVAEEKDLVPTSSSAADGDAPEDAAKKTKRGGGKRKRPVKWTKEEHILFLEGLEKYGKGKWKVMASEFLATKTASQIASHHQKHSKRLEQKKRNECKRSSIHDITAPTTSSDVSSKGPDELVETGEEFPGFDDLGTLFA